MTVVSTEPLVTIGIPTYNRAQNGNLQRVIERSLGQTYQNVEVIVSDNCSDDNSSEVVTAIKDPRLRYFRQKSNIGANSNFNFCLNQAKGKYFLLFHDDDSIDPDFIESCITSLKEGQTAGIFFTGVRVINESEQILEEHQNNANSLSPSEFVLAWFKGTVALFLCNTLYNTEYLKKTGGFHSKNNLYDDLVPSFSLIAKYDRVDVQDIKASFRRHSNNRGSSISTQIWIDEGVFLLGLLKKIFPNQSEVISEVGGNYFCKKMYHKSLQQPFLSRWANYFRSYKAFEYRFSPFGFVYQQIIRPKFFRAIRRLGFAQTN